MNAIQALLLALVSIITLVMGVCMTIGIYPMPGPWTDGIFYCSSIALAGVARLAYVIND